MKEINYKKKIIEQTGLTKLEIQELIGKKKERFPILLTNQMILKMVCKDLRIDLENNLKTNKKNKIEKEVKENMNEKEDEIIQPVSGLRNIDKRMALTVHDEREGIREKNEIMITHYPSEEEVLFLIKRRKFVKEKLIDSSDKMKIGGNIFLMKSAWRKYINAFGISIEILSQNVYDKDDDTIAEYRVRATAPNSQFVEADGTKSKKEYWSERHQNFGSFTLHNLKATARTRAINIAVSDLVGYGETSAEEQKIPIE